METLLLDGKNFVKASKIAKDYGYTSDYIGQLCRGGKVTAKLVGRSWYVEIDSLEEHRANRYKKIEPENTEPKKGFAVTIHSTPESAAHKSQLETTAPTQKQQASVQPLSFVNKRFYDRIPKYAKPVAYDHDESELIPATEVEKPHLEKPKEISISLAEAETVAIKAESPKYRFETTERPVVRFSGDLSVSALPDEQPVELPPEPTAVKEPVRVEMTTEEPLATEDPSLIVKGQSDELVHVVPLKKLERPTPSTTAATKFAGSAYIIPTRRADAGTGEIKDVTITRNAGSASSVFHKAVLMTATVTAVLFVIAMLGFEAQIVSTSKHTAEAISFSVSDLKAAVYGSK